MGIGVVARRDTPNVHVGGIVTLGESLGVLIQLKHLRSASLGIEELKNARGGVLQHLQVLIGSHKSVVSCSGKARIVLRHGISKSMSKNFLRLRHLSLRCILHCLFQYRIDESLQLLYLRILGHLSRGLVGVKHAHQRYACGRIDCLGRLDDALYLKSCI